MNWTLLEHDQNQPQRKARRPLHGQLCRVRLADGTETEARFDRLEGFRRKNADGITTSALPKVVEWKAVK